MCHLQGYLIRHLIRHSFLLLAHDQEAVSSFFEQKTQIEYLHQDIQPKETSTIEFTNIFQQIIPAISRCYNIFGVQIYRILHKFRKSFIYCFSHISSLP